MATIGIEGMAFHAYHGVYDEERTKGGHYQVSVWAEMDIARAAATDSIAHTLDYTQVHALTAALMAQPVNLIETLAVQLAAQVSSLRPDLLGVTVRIEKHKPPLDADVELTSCTHTWRPS